MTLLQKMTIPNYKNTKWVKHILSISRLYFYIIEHKHITQGFCSIPFNDNASSNSIEGHYNIKIDKAIEINHVFFI